jgi:hypothetical protein
LDGVSQDGAGRAAEAAVGTINRAAQANASATPERGRI